MRSDQRTARRGSTLLELLVVLSILAVIAAVVAPGLPSSARPPANHRSAVRAVRAAAIRAATPIRTVEHNGNSVRLILADPTGRVIVDSTRESRAVPGGTP